MKNKKIILFGIIIIIVALIGLGLYFGVVKGENVFTEKETTPKFDSFKLINFCKPL